MEVYKFILKQAEITTCDTYIVRHVSLGNSFTVYHDYNKFSNPLYSTYKTDFSLVQTVGMNAHTRI